MSGYAATARLRGGSMRCIVARSEAHLAASRGAPAPAVVDRQPVDLVGRPIGDVLAERWAELRETWSQTTFFLFDPESWR